MASAEPAPEALNVAAVVLAGGAARRMGGGDKPLRLLGGRPLLDHVLDRLAPQLPAGRAAIAVSANSPPERFAAFGAPVLPDADPDARLGPLAGVLAGMDWAAERGAALLVSAAGDTPFFPEDLVGRLAAARRPDAPIALAATQDADDRPRAQPTFGLWPVALRDDLRAALHGDGVRKILAWTDRHGAALAPFSVAPVDPFFNVNTPEDLDEAERLLRSIERV